MPRGRRGVERRRAAAGARAGVARDRRHRPRLLPEIEREGLLREIDVEVEEAASQARRQEQGGQRANRRCSPCHLPSTRHSATPAPATSAAAGRLLRTYGPRSRLRDPLTRTFSATAARANLVAMPSPAMVALLVVAAFFAGLVDAIAGGGGLMSLPALLAAGLPPHVALGTNKGQAVFGATASAISFWRRGMVDRDRAAPRLRRRLRRLVPGRLGRAGGAAPSAPRRS